MAEESTLETKVTALGKQIQEQAKFTRTVIALCSAAILGVLFWIFVQICTILPDMVVAKYMANLDKIFMLWHLTEAKNVNKQQGTNINQGNK